MITFRTFFITKFYSLGIIQKQALRNTIIGFAGAGLGAISRISMPLIISEAQIGLLQLLDAVSGIFVSIFNLGYFQVLARIFPRYRNDENGHYGFLMFGIFISLIGILASWVVYLFFGEYLFQNGKDSFLMNAFAFLIFPLIFFRILFKNTNGYVNMLYNSVIGTFLGSFVVKVLFLAALATFWLSLIDFEFLVYCYAFTLCLPGIVIIFYAFSNTKKISLPHHDLIQKSNHKEIANNMLFGVLLGASGSIVLYVDSLMVNKMISMAALGIYSTFFFAARLMFIPVTSIGHISSVVLADAWKKNDLVNIQTVYRKSSLNQLLIGVYLFGVGWACLDPALTFLPDYVSGKYVFFFIGLGILFEMLTGVNTTIIATSEKYKFNTYFNLLLTVFAVVLNLIFINLYGIIGAAIASMLAMIIVNCLRWYLLFRSYKLQPFDKTFLKSLIIGIVFILICCLIDYEANPLVEIGINTLLLTAVFWFTVIKMKLSSDVNQWLKKMKNKFTKA